MLTDFQTFFTVRFTSKYATKSSLTIPPHLISPGAQCDPISNVRPKGLRPGTCSWWAWNMGMGILKFPNYGMHQGAPLNMPKIVTLISNLRPSKIPS